MPTSNFQLGSEAGGDHDAPIAAARPPATLGSEELGAIEAVGVRLRSELARLVRALPADSRSVRTMAATLGVDRNTCQRVIAAVQPARTGAEAFVHFPGVKPLRQLVARAAAGGMDTEVVQGVGAAVERLAEVIGAFDQSHQRLKSRVEATLIAGMHRPDRTQLDLRRRLYEDHARLLRRAMEVHSLVTAVAPRGDDAERLEQAWVRGLVGLRVDAPAPPVPLGLAATEDDGTIDSTFDPLAQPTREGGRTAGVVAELSTSPVPTITTHLSPTSQVLVVDPTTLDGSRGADLAIASRVGSVARPDKLFHTSTVMLTPAARLVFDVYLHRSLAMSSLPSCGVFQYTMSFSGDMDENWPFRLPGQHRMELLGRGLGNSDSPAWGRHAAAAAHLFARTGWPADEFVGYRMDVAYPLWGSTAYQWFDFRSLGP